MDFDFSTESINPDALPYITIGGTAGVVLPAGNIADRPIGVAGMYRYNIETNAFEGYGGASPSWGSAGGQFGWISLTGNLKFSVQGGITSTGSIQGDAYPLTVDRNVVTTVALGTGVVLPTNGDGLTIVIINRGANVLSVYPASGSMIDALGTNIAATIQPGGSSTFTASSTQWYTMGVVNTFIQATDPASPTPYIWFKTDPATGKVLDILKG